MFASFGIESLSKRRSFPSHHGSWSDASPRDCASAYPALSIFSKRRPAKGSRLSFERPA
jgi:hypothetical protein